MYNTTLDLSSKQFSHNPYLIYNQLRKKGPVHFLSKNNTWLVVGFKEIVSILNNPSVYTSMGENSFDPILLNCDPPNHTVHRRILSNDQAPFSTNRVKQLESQNTGIIKRIINGLKDKKTIDVLKDISLPFSSLVILNLLGINTEDNKALREWSLSAVTNESIHNADYAQERWLELKPIIQGWIEEIKKKPSSRGLAEILFDSYAKENFSDDEVLNLTKVLLLGGNETTPNLISSALYILLTDHVLLDEVKNDLSLIDSVINETLRLEAPTQIIQRSTKEEVNIGNTIIPKDSLISIAIGAANRDPRIFESPDKFILDRKKSKILSFGFGPHYCIGAHLARQEARIALEQLLTTFPDIRLVPNELIRYRHSSHIRGIKELNLRVDPIKKYSINDIKSKLVISIKNEQLDTGEFPTYEFYPDNINLLDKGWHISEPSPFVHANIILSLMKLDQDLFNEEINKGLSFIKMLKEEGNVWRFWSIKKGINNVPPDADDTALCSIVLKLNKETPENRLLFLKNIGSDGELRTWFTPSVNQLFTSPFLWSKWFNEKKYINSTLQAGLLDPKDYELGVMANVLMFLGEDFYTRPVIDLCIKMWLSDKIESHFYNSKIVVAYHISRAYNSGVHSFVKIKESVVKTIIYDYKKYNLSEQILAGITLSYFNYSGESNVNLKKLIIEGLEKNDLELSNFGYFTSKDRNYQAGSLVLVATWLIELINLWEKDGI